MTITLQAAAAGLMIATSPFAGSFAATFVRDSLAGERVFKPSFHCGACGHRLAGPDLVPLYSWAATAGRCRYCGTRIPSLYPSVELAFVAAAVIAFLLAPLGLVLPAALLGWTSIVLSAFDILGFVLPDFLTGALALGGFGLAAASGGSGAALESGAGFLAGGASILLVKAVYRAVTGRDGLGLGDVKLFAAAGAWVGAPGLPHVLLIASLLGLVLAANHPAGTTNDFLKKKIPFGAALCAALWLVWIWEPLTAAGRHV